MTSDELMAAIAQNYPEVYALINKPGIFDVMQQAFADPNHQWTAAQIDQAIHQTEYYRTTSDTQRQWDIVQATDPATAKQRGDEMTTQILGIAHDLGINLTPDQQWNLVTGALGGAWDTATIKHNLLFGAAFTGLDTSSGTGQIVGTAQSVKSLAGQYAVPMSDEAARKWALGIADGAVTQDGLTAYMTEQAKSMFPGLASALDRGVTVRQYADPYLQIAAQNLGVDPNSIDLTDQKWGQALNQVDPKTGDRRAMSLAEWTKTIRSDTAFGYSGSQQGQAAGAQFAEAIGQRMGIV